MSKLISTAIVGANGYAGRELARLLLRHPQAKLIATLGRNDSWRLSDELPESSAQAVPHYKLSNFHAISSELDTIFLATPAEISLQLLPILLGKSIKIIDLSGALRLPAEDYALWYGQQHTHPELIAQASYGLSPWWGSVSNPEQCQLIANPGCYATCAQMALLPLLCAQIIRAQHIIIDAKSGLSGAGRQPKEGLLFCDMANDFYPYKIACHQHQPEIEFYLKKFSASSSHNNLSTTDTDKPDSLILNTQVLPIKRGISMSVYAHLAEKYAHMAGKEVAECIYNAFHSAYHAYPLARYADLSQISTTKQKQLLSLTQVVGSARIHIAWQIVNCQLLIFATIDNLLKGAASQAIENFNLIHGIPCTTTLDFLEGGL